MTDSSYVMSMCMASPGVLACGCVDNTVKLWDVKRRTMISNLKGHSDFVVSLCMVSKDVLASGSRDDTVRLWDLRTGHTKMVLEGHSHYVNAVCMVSPGVLASGSSDNTIRLWDTDTGDCINTLMGHSVYIGSLCSVSKDVFASGSGDGTILLWDTKTGAVIRKLYWNGLRIGDPRGMCQDVMSLCMVTPRVMASGYMHRHRGVILWDVKTGETLCVFPKIAEETVTSLCMVCPGVLAVRSSDRVIGLWDMNHATVPALVGNTDYTQCLCMVSPGVLASGGRTVRLWDLNDYRASSPGSGRQLQRISNGDCFTSAVLLPGIERRTYNQAAWAVALASLRRNRERYGTHTHNGFLALPEYALRLVGEFVG